MGDNKEQEAADLDAINNDGDHLFEVIYFGGRLKNDYDDDENPPPPCLRDYIIPDGVNIRLVIHASVMMIDEEACMDCTTLIEVIFHNRVITIGRDAFGECSNLRIVELPAGLLRLEACAFEGCRSLRGEITIPASVRYMGDDVLSHCSSLESVVFVPRTASIELGSYMFHSCSILRFVTLPNNLRSIPHGCFEDCTSLTHLQIPESVEEIEDRAFRGSGLRSVTISENVHRIRWAAFGNCAFLERVIIYSTNLNLRPNIFVDCPILSTIMIAPWLWPKLFVSMNEHPKFIFKFVREYHTQIFDFQIVNPDVEVE